MNSHEPHRNVSAADFLPLARNLTALRLAAQDCKGCDLYRRARQTVFGVGPRTATTMLVGEMPGDQEDIQGRPFVGPAGRLLAEVLQEVGLGPRSVYLTNAVKHFKWEERGKRRLHKKPSMREVTACRPWLEAEIDVVRPKLLVCLGATAAQSLLGRDFRITRRRGEMFPSRWAPCTMATYHPSAILRVPEKVDRDALRRQFTDDLRAAVHHLRHVEVVDE